MKGRSEGDKKLCRKTSFTKRQILRRNFEIKNQGLCERIRERKFEDKWKGGR